jgi:hypothetical protein
MGEGSDGAGLGATLLLSKGMAAWIRGWQACTPPSSGARPPRANHPSSVGPQPEVVVLLTAMALACAEGM